MSVISRSVLIGENMYCIFSFIDGFSTHVFTQRLKNLFVGILLMLSFSLDLCMGFLFSFDWLCELVFIFDNKQ